MRRKSPSQIDNPLPGDPTATRRLAPIWRDARMSHEVRTAQSSGCFDCRMLPRVSVRNAPSEACPCSP